MTVAVTTLRTTLATALENAGVWQVFSYPPASPIANSVIVGCGVNESVEIVELTPSGKNEMKASDWARGARILPGEIFG